MSGRPGKPAGGFESFIRRDHEEIAALLRAVRFERPFEAGRRFAEFVRRLDRHIRWEEEILFPAAEGKAPHLALGPLAAMRMEHLQIRENNAGARSALRGLDGRLARHFADGMAELLRAHISREERLFYPILDASFSEAEWRAALEAIRGVGGAPPPNLRRAREPKQGSQPR